MSRWIPVVAALAIGCSTTEPVSASPPVSVVQSEALGPGPAEREATTGAEAAPAGIAHRVIADDGHPIAVWGKAPPHPRGAIVLIHGRTWSGRPDFDLQVAGRGRSTMDALVRRGYAAYAVDLRGYGATPRDDTGWNTPDRAALDVVAVLEFVRRETSVERVALLGWSLGSLTTQLVAQRRPDLVGAAVLFGYPRAVGHRYDAGPAVSTAPAAARTTAKAAAEDFIRPDVIDRATIDAFVEAALRHDPVKADWRAMDQWSELDPAKLAVPTLLIHGEHDPYAPVRRQAELFSRIAAPDRAYVIVAGGDHAAHLEDSGARFVHAVVSFLERPTLHKRLPAER